MTTATTFSKEIKFSEIEIGKTYPLYGMITKIISESSGYLVVELNHSIIAKLYIPEPKNIELVKERAFEPGVFMSKVTTTYPTPEVEVSAAIFGKRDSTLYT